MDATFSFYENVTFLAYLARTQTPEFDGEDTSYQGRFDYGGDRYGFQGRAAGRRGSLHTGGRIRPTGQLPPYVREWRYSPRPQSIDAIRQFSLEGSLDYIVTADTGQVETRQTQLGFSTEFENSDRIGVGG